MQTILLPPFSWYSLSERYLHLPILTMSLIMRFLRYTDCIGSGVERNRDNDGRSSDNEYPPTILPQRSRKPRRSKDVDGRHLKSALKDSSRSRFVDPGPPGLGLQNQQPERNRQRGSGGQGASTTTYDNGRPVERIELQPLNHVRSPRRSGSQSRHAADSRRDGQSPAYRGPRDDRTTRQGRKD